MGMGKYNSYRRWFEKAWERALDLIYPPHCPACDSIMEAGGERICPECRDAFRLQKEPLCKKCGRALSDETEEYCKDCQKGTHAFDEGAALYEYGSVRDAIFRFKYMGRQEYRLYFGRMMAEELGEKIRSWKADAIIPVPIHKERLRKRGYNQAELLAAELGKALSIPVRTDYVRRVRNTAPQKALNAVQRQNNLKKAFKIGRNDVKLKTIIIIDDIYTTGSTIDEIAKVCRRAGAERVCFVVLAMGSG